MLANKTWAWHDNYVDERDSFVRKLEIIKNNTDLFTGDSWRDEAKPARKTQGKLLSLALLLGFVCSTASAAVEVTNLGTLGGEQSVAFAINESDQVVGLSWTSSGSNHSFLYSSGQMTDLYPLNSQDMITGGPTGINNFGQVASGVIATDGTYYPAVYDNRTGGITTLGALGGATSYGFSGVATAINNSGQAV